MKCEAERRVQRGRGLDRPGEPGGVTVERREGGVGGEEGREGDREVTAAHETCLRGGLEGRPADGVVVERVVVVILVHGRSGPEQGLPDKTNRAAIRRASVC